MDKQSVKTPIPAISQATKALPGAAAAGGGRDGEAIYQNLLQENPQNDAFG